jgi:RES domain-containing protein
LTLWRISNHVTLDGRGGQRTSARWHTRGHRVVYSSPNPATALLEVLVHAEINPRDMPVSFRFLEINVPDNIALETIERSHFPSGWERNAESTQQVGDEWLDSGRGALLRVPCVIVPETYNVLLNPQHADTAQITIRKIHRHPFDRRLTAGASSTRE